MTKKTPDIRFCHPGLGLSGICPNLGLPIGVGANKGLKSQTRRLIPIAGFA